jgi:hypothetical protein
MPRRLYARTSTDMPDEPSIKALDVEPQWLYDRLRFRPEMTRCGVVPYRPSLWAELANNATERKVRGWARQLVTSNHLVIDEPRAECLIRTYVRHDGLLSQPNVVANMVNDFHLITSEKIRLAFLIEFRRLWDLPLPDGERGGWLLGIGHYPRKKHGKDDPAQWPIALTADALARLTKAVGQGFRAELAAAVQAGDVRPFPPDDPHGLPEPFADPSTNPTPNPSPNPLRAVSPESRAPSPGVLSPSPEQRVRASDEPAEPFGPADTHTPTMDADPDQLIATHVGQTTGAVRIGLRDQVTTLAAEGITETTIAAALTAWASKPGSGPGLLAYLANDLLLDDRLKSKPSLTVNGNAPDWCGDPDCDPDGRWREGPDGWTRCPRCHPNAPSPATPSDTTPANTMTGHDPDDPWTPPTPVAAFVDEPPF